MKFLLLVACFTASLLTFAYGQTDADYNAYRVKYGKRYSCPEETKRHMENYFKNKNAIEAQNKRFREGKSTFQVAANQFGDMSYEEALAIVTGYKPPVKDANNRIPNAVTVDNTPEAFVMAALPATSVPAAVDWRTRGAVSPVKNQGSCGSCWAFTANAALESHNYIKNKKMVILSEQNLVDCTTNNTKNNNMYFSRGCNGGVTSRVFNFIRDQPGAVSQSTYPYMAKVGTCKFIRANVVATDKGFVSLAADEAKIKDAVARIGPVAAAMHASRTFMLYKSGIYNEVNCPTAVNHAVLIVGYGVEKGVNFWIVKNSWGTGWGEAGFFRIARGTNKCGISSYATYPVL